MSRAVMALVALVGLLLAPARASAQPTSKLFSLNTSGTITANGGSVVLLNTGGLGTLRVQVPDASVYTGTWILQCSAAPAGATPVYGTNGINMTLDGSSAAPVTSVTSAVGQWKADISGCTAVRVLANSAYTGTQSVSLSAISTGGSAGGGSSSGGTQFAEDAAHVSGDIGTLALAVRNDPGTALAGTTGDYIPLSTDANGSLRVVGSSGTTQFAEDAVHASGDSTVFISGIRRDTTPSSSSGTDGDYSAFNLDANGRLYTNSTLYNSSGTELTPATDKAEDAAHVSGDTGPVVLAKRTDVAAVSSGTDGDYSTVNVDALGQVWTRQLDPCTGVAKTVLPINISTATTTEITPSLAGASTNYYVCSLALIVAGADNVAIADDDTDNCASVTAGMAGGTTAASGFNFAANGGLTLGNGESTVMKTNGTNRVICIVTSAAVQLSGVMTVVAAP